MKYVISYKWAKLHFGQIVQRVVLCAKLKTRKYDFSRYFNDSQVKEIAGLYRKNGVHGHA